MPDAGRRPPDPPAGGLLARLKAALFGPPTRPGDQDPVRSPFVLLLGFGSVALLLAAVVVWLVIQRTAAQRLFETAKSELDQRKYLQAIEAFENYLVEYPHADSAPEARILLGRARIARYLEGSQPEWKAGLEQLQQFVREHRDREGFADLQPHVFESARAITLGASEDVQRNFDRDLLPVIDEARALALRHAGQNVGDDLEDALQQAFDQAEAAVHRNDVYRNALARAESLLEGDSPLEALDERRQLLDRFPVYEDDEALVSVLDRSLQSLREAVTSETPNRPAATAERESPVSPPLTLVRHTRATTDRPVGRRCVRALAGGCCFGVDTVTGTPVWRRVVGLDSPFFPVEVDHDPPALLLFDGPHQELQLVQRDDGRLIWRQPTGARPSGPPAVEEGLVYLTTEAGTLLRLSLSDGELLQKLTFPDGLLAPPVPTSDGARLVVAGRSSVVYALEKRPLRPLAASHLGHRPGAVAAPLVGLGPLVLLAENDRRQSSRLRVLDTRDRAGAITQIAESRLSGHVLDSPAGGGAPVVRGRQLFVPHGHGRVAVFQVSAEAGQPVLARLASYAPVEERDLPTYVRAGSGNEFWTTDTYVRRLQVEGETIHELARSNVSGIFSQPLQTVRNDLFPARRKPYSKAVFLTQADRSTLRGEWQVVLGGLPLAWTATDGGLLCATDNGAVVHVDDLQRAGFLNTTTVAPLSPDDSEPLRAFAFAGGLVIETRGSQPRLTRFDANGVEIQAHELPSALQAAPVPLAGGVAVPVEGRVRLLGRPGGAVDDLEAVVQPEDDVDWLLSARLDENHLALVDTSGTLQRIACVDSPRPHLSSVARTPLPPGIRGMAVHAGRLVTAHADGTLRTFDADSLDARHEAKLKGPVTGGPWPVGDDVYVELSGRRLVCVRGQPPQAAWSVETREGIAHRPALWQGGLLAATRDGELLRIDPATGEINRRLPLGHRIVLGPLVSGSRVLVATLDGSLHSVEGALAP